MFIRLAQIALLASLVSFAGAQLPNAPSIPDATGGSITGTVADTEHAAIPGATITLYLIEPHPAPKNSAVQETRPGKPAGPRPETKAVATTEAQADGSFTFADLAPANYLVYVAAKGFQPWKIDDVAVTSGLPTTLQPVELGVEALTSEVNAITVEDLAEQQITAEEHQRILGVLPNFFVSYVPNAQPLTSRQKFKLAFVIVRDPVTFGTTAITAGIEQAQGDLSGYGPGFAGYASRYGAAYGDHVSSTFLGAAILPSLLHQDPRYFYNGHGTVVHRALYAIATTVICKGDNGHWQFNASNVFGNLGGAFISSLYYPPSANHSVQVTVSNTLLGVAEGSFSTLFQEFVIRHFTKGAPPVQQP